MATDLEGFPRVDVREIYGDHDEVELFDVPDYWRRYKRCRVCGGPLSVTCSHTYAMQRQGWVKIGASSNPAERLSMLGRQGMGCRVRTPEGMDWAEPILLLGLIEGDVEHSLHLRFANCYAGGEWFLPDAVMRDWLASGELRPLSDFPDLPQTVVRKVPRLKPDPAPIWGEEELW